MVGRREAQGNVDLFLRLACFEAVRRNGPVSAEGVAQWSNLPVADVQRHLDALIHQRRIAKAGERFITAS